MTTTIVPADSGTIIVSIEYSENGLDWARLYDNECIAWAVDGSSMPMPPRPSIIGTLPLLAPDTSPILSPQWVKFIGSAVMVPNVWRGLPVDFFEWLATNNGASRRLDARFGISGQMHDGFTAFARSNPDLVYSD
jgi:hypothetical protein